MKLKLLFIILILFSTIFATSWKYSFEINNENTVLEGKIGVLSYCGIKIDPKIKLIQTEIGCFKFVNNKELWENKGWLKCKEYNVIKTDAIFSYEIIGNKWYKSPKLSKTPKEWAYLVNYDIWINPHYIEEFCLKYLKSQPELYVNTDITTHKEIKKIIEKKLQNKLDNNVSMLNNKNWKYKIIYEVPLEKTGRRGFLFYKNKMIPEIKGSIITPLGRYIYRNSEFKYEDKGWFLINNIKIERSNLKITEKNLRKGYYKGKYRSSTPNNWIYCVKENKWITIDKI